MKFRRRNIYSTCWSLRFRRSAAEWGTKKLCIHRLPHRLCTSYALYCTGYPQRARLAGFAGGAMAASVAGYLFSAAETGPVVSVLAHLASAKKPFCGKAVDIGDNPGSELVSGPPARNCRGPRVDLEAADPVIGGREQDGSPGGRPRTNGGRQLCQSHIWIRSRLPVDRTRAESHPRTSLPNSRSWAA